MRLDLARGFTPAANERVASTRVELPSGEVFELAFEGDSASLAFHVTRDEWRFAEGVAAHLIRRGVRGYPDDDSQGYELVGDGRAFMQTPFVGGRNATIELSNGGFAARSGMLYARVEEGAEPPGEATLTYRPRRGHLEQGVWRVSGRRFSGTGLSVWPGERARRPIQADAGSVLRFATAAERAERSGPRDRPTRVVFRVSCGEETLLEHPMDVPDDGAFRWHAVDLAPFAERATELVFSVEGDFAYTTFFAPRIDSAGGDAKVEEPGGRPDIVVFLADTFRADNLMAYGGELPVAPFLDELAARSLFFERAWSVGTYTLTSHASAMTGRLPRQAGIENEDCVVSEELTTIAELLSRNGYRTGAITDAVYVSRSYGLDQGFDWFDELRLDMASTTERVEAFLDGDDGRPTFLFVQSYATHTPYDVTEATRAAWADRLDLAREFGEVKAEVKGYPKSVELMSPDQLESFRPLVSSLRGSYLGSVVDFDAAVRDFHGRLTQRGLLPDGYFVFVSDHGESFFEHGTLFHQNEVYEEEARIPLMLTGPGIEAESIGAPVSLVDLAPTVADMAGLARRDEWMGTSLFETARERGTARPVYVFQCVPSKRSTWAVVEGTRKWIGYENEADFEEGEILGAFELGEDPGETHDLAAEEEWPAETTRRMRSRREELFTPQVEVRRASDDVDRLQGLAELGYAGDG